ncbi:DUF362 domain-containing protein [Candidatus Margulisiibacteriota bacterium]
MSSKVYFLKAKDISNDGLKKLFTELDIPFLNKGELVAVKTHFGEAGNKAYLKPEMIKPIIDMIKGKDVRAFLTDANTIYKGSRSDSVSHLNTAYAHGYTQEKMGVPVIIADGLTGKESVEIKVGLKHLKEVKLAAAAVHADSMIVLTHFKGHELTGFGGSLKNVGMGLGTRAGKQIMHSDVKPNVDQEKCTGCGTCVKWCPTDAIKLVNEKAIIDQKKCIGCGECVASCNYDAIAISWAGAPDSIQEKIAEYFYGIWKDKKGKMAYFNYVIEVSPNCDCYDWNDPPIVQDIGVLASFDPVAIDQAGADLVNDSPWDKNSKFKSDRPDKFKSIYPSIDWSVQLKHAEKIGLGSREYQLIKV